MSGLRIRAYAHEDASAWDEFCGRSVNATFLHTRRFLSYHGDRFHDVSCIVEEGGRWTAVLPAAIASDNQKYVVSHPGITYGGLLHDGSLVGDKTLIVLDMIAAYYRGAGYYKLRYKAVPYIYHKRPAQDDIYALFRLGATRYRCDLSSTIDLSNRHPVSERRKRGLRKAQKSGIEVLSSLTLLPQFWLLLEENLANRHGAQPVHTLQQIQELIERFPDNIELVCANTQGSVVAGTLLFISNGVHHAQYIASNDTGRVLSALDAVFEYCIDAAKNRARYFDFGISNEKDGQLLNQGLYRFKTEFGGSGTVCEFYELALR